jgi:hypothetical protein
MDVVVFVESGGVSRMEVSGLFVVRGLAGLNVM